MKRVIKPINLNYITGDYSVEMTVNERNRKYIDRFIREEYESLRKKYSSSKDKINNTACDSIDILNNTLTGLYYVETVFSSWDEARAYLSKRIKLI